MAEKIILQITGQPGAGKSDVSEHLSEKYGFTRVLVSDLIRAYATPRGIPLQERYDFKAAHSRMLTELGKLTIVNSILETPSDLICVDGIRVPAHSEKLRESGPKSKVVALHCSPEIRYERATARKGALDKTGYEAFLHDEELESRSPDPYVQSTLTVMESADYNVDSSRAPEYVNADIDTIVEPLLLAL